MKKRAFNLALVLVVSGMALGFSGCALSKIKLTPKRTAKKEAAVFLTGRVYDVKPSMDLYEKHYIFWVNWHKKFIERLGKNTKSDLRSSEEMISNLEDMSTLLTDDMSEALVPHIAEVKKIKAIIRERNLTKANETRIRHIAEREYRAIKRDFRPKKIKGYIRDDWRPGGDD
ncbi:MAG: hypothetical protein NG740_02545 [Omnitrophica bacterium]|nr:hypothetical protein [Candidatus Omnitrophota bacterium]